MDKAYYTKDLKLVLLRNFKQSFTLQEFANQDLTHAINEQKDPIELLEYLRDSVYITIKEEADMLRPMLASIRDIASLARYYTRNGSDVVSVTNNFTSLMKSMKLRESQDGVVAVIGCHETGVAKARNVQFNDPPVNGNKGSSEFKIIPTTNTNTVTTDEKTQQIEYGPSASAVVPNKSNLNERKHKYIKINAEKESADKKDRASNDDDWVAVEEGDIDDFVMV